MPERKPRQRITFSDRLDRLQKRIDRLNQAHHAAILKREALVKEYRAKAESMLKEAGVE